MPVLTSHQFAKKFQESWLSRPPEEHPPAQDVAPLDDSLTSLHWLQNFSILSAEPERPEGPPPRQHLVLRRLGCPRAGTDSPSSPPAGDTAAGTHLLHPGSPVTTSTFVQEPRFPTQSPPVEVDYKTNSRVKPPYSYASLICMAMQASKQPKVTLSTIYSWITHNFCYYRHAEPSWQNSIRHNLSLNKCFKKVPRRKDEPGKGGFWQIDPQYADMFVNGIFKRRRLSANHYRSGGATQRQNRPAQGSPDFTNTCPNQRGAGKRKALPPKKAERALESPLLAMEVNRSDVLKGDFDLASVFDDVFSGSCSTFEDLDLNTALSSLGCEMDISVHGRQHTVGISRWYSGADIAAQIPHIGHHHAYGYVDLGAASMEELHSSQHPAQRQHEGHDQLIQGQSHFHHFNEATGLLAEQAGGTALQPWEEIKEEAVPLTLDQGFGLYEGFFSEIQQWE